MPTAAPRPPARTAAPTTATSDILTAVRNRAGNDAVEHPHPDRNGARVDHQRDVARRRAGALGGARRRPFARRGPGVSAVGEIVSAAGTAVTPSTFTPAAPTSGGAAASSTVGAAPAATPPAPQYPYLLD